MVEDEDGGEVGEEAAMLRGLQARRRRKVLGRTRKQIRGLGRTTIDAMLGQRRWHEEVSLADQSPVLCFFHLSESGAAARQDVLLFRA